MPRVVVRVTTSIKSRREAEDYAHEQGADLENFTIDRRTGYSFVDLSFENVYTGNSFLDYHPEAESVVQYEDGSTGKHYVRRERHYDD